MRVLLDECVDRRLASAIRGHEVATVPDAGWSALQNGELLARAQGEFDVFVTVDRNLPFQQDLSRFSIAVVVLRAQSTRVSDLRELIPRLLAALPGAKRARLRGLPQGNAIEATPPYRAEMVPGTGRRADSGSGRATGMPRRPSLPLSMS